MEYINATVERGSFVNMREGLQVRRQKHQGLKFLMHSVAAPSTNTECVEQADHHHKLQTITFNRPQTGPKQEEELDDCKRTRSSTKARPDARPPRYRGRVFTSSTNQLRELAPTPTTPASKKALASTELPPSLDGWMIDYLPIRLSTKQKSAVWSYLDILVLRTYAYDWCKDHPHELLPTKDIYQGIVQDVAVLQCVITVGALSEMIRHRRSEDLATISRYCAELCSILNGLMARPRSWSRDFVLMHGIAALALLCIMMGDYSQWHIHMKGLQSLMELKSSMPKSLKWLAFRTDLIGSCETATVPYLSIGRHSPSLFDRLTKDDRVGIRNTVRRSLSICSSEESLEIFESVGLLCSVLHLSDGGKKLDCDSVMEQAYACWNGLLIEPVSAGDLFLVTSILTAQSDPHYNTAEYLPTEVPPGLEAAEAALSFPKCIETAVRLCFLLYIKSLSHYNEDIAWGRPKLMSVFIYCAEQLIDVLEESGYGEDGISPQHNSYVHEVINATRPALIWMCLIGWTCLKMLFSDKRDLLVNSRLLAIIIGPNESSVDDLPESAFEFCRKFNPKDIAADDDWDSVEMLKDIISYIH